MALKDLIKIRESVAVLNGFREISKARTSNREGLFIALHGVKNGEYQLIPEYENSLEAIWEALLENKIAFALQAAFKDDEICCLAINFVTKREHFSPSPALALCYLFIAEKSRQAVIKHT